jgi:hypothetical protein
VTSEPGDRPNSDRQLRDGTPRSGLRRYLDLPRDPRRSVMVILGLALKALGFGSRVAAMVAAPVVAVLAWGAIENGIDKRKNKTIETGKGF